MFSFIESIINISCPTTLDYGVRPTGYRVGNNFIQVDEMIPDIVVPDLTGFKVKPFIFFNRFSLDNFKSVTFS